jgi:hypothetical protein
VKALTQRAANQRRPPRYWDRTASAPNIEPAWEANSVEPAFSHALHNFELAFDAETEHPLWLRPALLRIVVARPTAVGQTQ